MVACIFCESWLFIRNQCRNYRDEKDEDRNTDYENPKRNRNVSGNSRPKPSCTYRGIPPEPKKMLSQSKDNGKDYSRNYGTPYGIFPNPPQSMTSILSANDKLSCADVSARRKTPTCHGVGSSVLLCAAVTLGPTLSQFEQPHPRPTACGVFGRGLRRVARAAFSVLRIV